MPPQHDVTPGGPHRSSPGPGIRVPALARRAAPVFAALLLVALGGLLRLEALFGTYGPIDHPRWAVAVQTVTADLAPHLRPSSVAWSHAADGYSAGDPAAYVRFAREMHGFYQAHLREPLFIAVTRGFLHLLDDQDIAVGFTSVLFGTLLVLAAWLLGREAFGEWVGLIAAGAMAVEFTAVSWAAEGWRDEAFAFFAVLTAWGLLRTLGRPSVTNAVIAGVAAGGACLTRITSLGFLAAGVLYLALALRATGWRQRIGPPLIALSVALLLVGPYLVNCAVTFGDPLYAIDFHTRFYRNRENPEWVLPDRRERPESAFHYVGERLANRPAKTLDTAVYGVSIFPFDNKWTGFRRWGLGLAGTLRLAAVGGLFLLAASRAGRFLLAFLLVSLLPYAFTWAIPGGGEWRFTLHAYPFYLVAAGTAIVFAAKAVTRLARRARRSGNDGTEPDGASEPEAAVKARGPASDLGRPSFSASAAAYGAALLLILVATTTVLPRLAMREVVAAGDTFISVPGEHDAGVFDAGWTDIVSGCAVAGEAPARLALALPRGEPYRVKLRLVAPSAAVASARRLQVFAGRGLQLVGQALLDPTDRNSSPEFIVPRPSVGLFSTPLTLVLAAPDRPGTPRTGDRSAAPYRLCSVTVARALR